MEMENVVRPRFRTDFVQIAAVLPGATKTKAAEAPGKISRAELQQDVMGFAEEYAVAVWQAADEIRRANLPLETRAAARLLNPPTV